MTSPTSNKPLSKEQHGEPLIGPRTCRCCHQFLAPRMRVCEHCGTR